MSKVIWFLCVLLVAVMVIPYCDGRRSRKLADIVAKGLEVAALPLKGEGDPRQSSWTHNGGDHQQDGHREHPNKEGEHQQDGHHEGEEHHNKEGDHRPAGHGDHKDEGHDGHRWEGHGEGHREGHDWEHKDGHHWGHHRWGHHRWGHHKGGHWGDKGHDGNKEEHHWDGKKEHDGNKEEHHWDKNKDHNGNNKEGHHWDENKEGHHWGSMREYFREKYGNMSLHFVEDNLAPNVYLVLSDKGIEVQAKYEIFNNTPALTKVGLRVADKHLVVSTNATILLDGVSSTFKEFQDLEFETGSIKKERMGNVVITFGPYQIFVKVDCPYKFQHRDPTYVPQIGLRVGVQKSAKVMATGFVGVRISIDPSQFTTADTIV